MQIGNFYFHYKPIAELKYHSIEFHLDKIDHNTELLNKLLKEGWKVGATYHTESGVVLELYRVPK